MSPVCCGGSDGDEIRRSAGVRWMYDGLALAASPTFAIMALLTGVLSTGPPDVLCSAAHHASPLNGMVVMYVLMSAFHTAPWLKLIARRRHSAHRA